MEKEPKLTPVALKERCQDAACLLALKGYAQASEMLLCPCPSCSVRFLLMLDPKDQHSAVEKQVRDYFYLLMAAQHVTEHPLDRLVASSWEEPSLSLRGLHGQ